MLEKIADEARIDIIKMIANANSGHPGGSLSCIDILIYLYHHEINLNKNWIVNTFLDNFYENILNSTGVL